MSEPDHICAYCGNVLLQSEVESGTCDLCGQGPFGDCCLDPPANHDCDELPDGLVPRIEPDYDSTFPGDDDDS